MNVMRRTVTGECSLIVNLTITWFSRSGLTSSLTSARKKPSSAYLSRSFCTPRRIAA